LVSLLVGKVGHKLKFDQTIENGATCLYLACQEGYTDVVQALLEHDNGRNLLYQKTDAGCTPLFIAVHTGHFNVTKIILDKVLEKEGQESTQKLLQYSALGTSLLGMSLQLARFDCVQLLVEHGIFIDLETPYDSLTPENQPIQVAVCVDVPGSLLQSIYKLAYTQIDVENNPATKTLKLENLKSAVTSAAKTAVFMLYMDALQHLYDVAKDVIDTTVIENVAQEVHHCSVSTLFELNCQCAAGEEVNGTSKKVHVMATLEKEIQHLRNTDHSFVTNGDIVTLLTKTGHVDYYDTLFEEYREVLLFRMASTCHRQDDEAGLEDVGHLVEHSAVPIEGLRRSLKYLSDIIPFMQYKQVANTSTSE
jgi:hypothetical protein